MSITSDRLVAKVQALEVIDAMRVHDSEYMVDEERRIIDAELREIEAIS